MRHRLPLALVTVAAMLALLIACGGNATPAHNTPSTPTPTASTTPPSSGGTTTPPSTTPPTTTPPSGGSGSGSSGTGSGGGAATGADFVYVGDGQSIYGESINLQNQTLHPTAQPTVAVLHLQGLAHAGQYVYAIAGELGSTVTPTLYIFRSDPTTGSLTLVNTIENPTGTYSAIEVATDPTQQYLYLGASSPGELIYGYKIDSSTGGITPIAGSPFQTNDSTGNGPPTRLHFTANGTLMFAVECPYAGRNCSTMAVSMQRDPSTGVLTRPANNYVTAGQRLNDIDLIGNYIIGTDYSSGFVVIPFDSTGHMSEATPKTMLATTQESCAVATQPSSGRFYIGSMNTSTGGAGGVSGFTIDSSGNVAAISGATVTTSDPGVACSVAFTPSGYLSWVTLTQLYEFSVNTSGTLTQIAGSPQPTGTNAHMQTSLHSNSGQ